VTWRERLQTASFRGVEFRVTTGDRTVGRRTTVHQFPGRNIPVVEDLGEEARRDTLDAYVLGDDYMVTRDRLLQAFRKPGAGPLVHPYWGRMTVTVVGQVRIRESTAEGGMARFTLSVVEGGEAVDKSVKVDTQQNVLDNADAAVTAMTDDFVAAWDTVDGVSEYVRTAASDLINAVNGVVAKLNRVKRYVNAAMNQVDAVGDAITALADTAAALILLPGQLVSTISDIITDVLASIASVGDAWDSYFTEEESAASIGATPSTAALGSTLASGDERVELILKSMRDGETYGADSVGGADESFPTVDETTAQRSKQAGNQDAMIALVRSLFVIEACRALANTPLVSFDQGVAARDEVTDALDTLAETADDESYYAIVELRAAISEHLSNASAELPRIIEFTPAASIPALAIAHNIYGDSTRDQDIIDRNLIRNPCIVPGYVTLEVLSSE